MSDETHADAEQLRLRLSSILGRIITVEEMWRKMDLKQSTYYTQRDEGRLLSFENLRTVARNFGINEVYLLVECGELDQGAAEQYRSAVLEEATNPTVPGGNKKLMTRTAMGKLTRRPRLNDAQHSWAGSRPL